MSVDYERLRRLAVRTNEYFRTTDGRYEPAAFWNGKFTYTKPEFQFLEACSPDVILGLLDTLERLERERAKEEAAYMSTLGQLEAGRGLSVLPDHDVRPEDVPPSAFAPVGQVADEPCKVCGERGRDRHTFHHDCIVHTHGPAPEFEFVPIKQETWSLLWRALERIGDEFSHLTPGSIARNALAEARDSFASDDGNPSSQEAE